MKGKVKYYLKKPRNEIVKDLFVFLAVGTGLALAANSPFFVPRLLKELSKKQKRSYTGLKTMQSI